MVALSDTHIVGLTVDMAYWPACDNFQPNPRYWVSPRSCSALPNPTQHPIPMEGRVGPLEVRTWGNYLAGFIVYDVVEVPPDKVAYGLVLVRSDDGRMRWIPVDRKIVGFEFTLDSQYLYTMPARVDPSIRYKSNFELFRYDLSRFEEIGLASPE